VSFCGCIHIFVSVIYEILSCLEACKCCNSSRLHVLENYVILP
jgi:hypothetical protein